MVLCCFEFWQSLLELGCHTDSMVGPYSAVPPTGRDLSKNWACKNPGCYGMSLCLGIALAVYSSLICSWTHPRDWLHPSTHGHESLTQWHRIDAACLRAKILPYAWPSCYCPLVAKSHWPNDTALTLAVNVQQTGPVLDHLQAIWGYLPFYLWNSKISAWRWLHHLQAEVDLVSTSLSQQLVKAINTFGFISIDNG